MKRLALLGLLVCLSALPALAQGVKITDAFARATAPGATTGVIYLSLQSPIDDKLTGAASPAAASAMMHKTTMAGMVMDMDMVSAIDLPAGQIVVLAPGKFHIMLEGLKHPLVKGSTIALHLTFAHAPAEDVSVPVGSLAAEKPGE